ncbi:MAG TPA: TIGR03557 family F420-dependent LLM class oxidoreductase [Blastocatellia bacterium]|nr:TIGR03557 family F420-dependent LLM class oxidoreductase [Blastocatellia bacterium]
MIEIGYALSSEEHAPNDLVRYARMAEETGFTFALISDHYHPWVDRQGHSPFVWSVIGAISHATEKLRLGTGVTCPTIRIHPAIIAQAAATAASMMPGRFFLGLGTGENLNEHILGERWPAHDIRLEMLEEAVEVIRLLWEGGTKSHFGNYYEVEKARIYTLPEKLPPIYIAGDGRKSAELAALVGDGRISVSPEEKLTRTFRDLGGEGKPMIGQFTACWAADEAEARRTAHEWWPNAGLKGQLFTELRTPSLFEQACELVTEDQVAEDVICGPDPKRHLEKIQEYLDGGFDQVYVHQVGPDQEGFMDFYKREILPEFKG